MTIQEYLTALASVCARGTIHCWPSLNDEANAAAKADFAQWAEQNQWVQPWDGFLEVASVRFPQFAGAARITAHYDHLSPLVIFNWYGTTWGIA